jgi:hypothetical protein
VCLILVGGENMPYIMDRQGQKLNNFSRISINYYARNSEWSDFTLLVREPSNGIINWHEDAITEIFNASNGNPYFTKIICAAVLRIAVEQRDADITATEVKFAIESEVSLLGSNSFAHLWQDGIPKPAAEREPNILARARTLVAIARCIRGGMSATLGNIAQSRVSIQISESEISAVINDFVRREVLHEVDGVFRFTLPIFEKWLVDVGAGQLAADSLSAELARAAIDEENAVLVTSEEVAKLCQSWPTYRGKHIGTDEIREWFQQAASQKDQRLLFDILKKVRFVTEAFVRERLKTAHALISPILPVLVTQRKSERRRDVIITYVDGEGKSGPNYASLYAEENLLPATCIFPPGEFQKRLQSHINSGGTVSVIVIIDDIAATGRSLIENVEAFVSNNSKIIKESNIPIRIISLMAMPDASNGILRSLQRMDDLDIDFRTCEILNDDVQAFPESGKGWNSRNDFDRAKSLCTDYGSKIFTKQTPLGYGGLGLLIVFPTNTPNNSLPILHSPARTGSGITWKPLFPRITH